MYIGFPQFWILPNSISSITLCVPWTSEHWRNKITCFYLAQWKQPGASLWSERYRDGVLCWGWRLHHIVDGRVMQNRTNSTSCTSTTWAGCARFYFIYLFRAIRLKRKKRCLKEKKNQSLIHISKSFWQGFFHMWVIFVYSPSCR